MPVVVMYMLSALPCSTTLVSPPTMATPARRAAFAMARTSASSTGVGSPASSTKVTTSASARAPETARSFTVPFTASSPIEPPGKRSGLTTKLSVVIAMLRAVDVDVRGVAQRLRETIRRAAARTALRPACGWPCRRRRAPSRFADRGTGSWERIAVDRQPGATHAIERQARSPLLLCGVRSCNKRRMILPTKPSARRPDAPACTPCRTACTGAASARPSALRRIARPWDRSRARRARRSAAPRPTRRTCRGCAAPTAR